MFHLLLNEDDILCRFVYMKKRFKLLYYLYYQSFGIFISVDFFDYLIDIRPITSSTHFQNEVIIILNKILVDNVNNFNFPFTSAAKF